jgi:cathepsin D
MPYGSGQVTGTLGSDTVSMAGFTISSQTLVLADELSGNVISGSASGLMGLAFQSIAVTNAVPFWQALVSDNQLASPEMSFYLARLDDIPADSDDENPGGTFTLGGTNSSFYTGNIEYTDFPSGVEESYWLLEMSCEPQIYYFPIRMY